MFRNIRCRVLAALVLVPALVLLSASPGQANSLFRGNGEILPDLLGSLWGALARIWGEEGSSLDPSGAPASGDEGSSLDPSGATAPADGDEGSGLDPNGSTTPADGDAGPELDPSGGR